MERRLHLRQRQELAGEALRKVKIKLDALEENWNEDGLYNPNNSNTFHPAPNKFKVDVKFYGTWDGDDANTVPSVQTMKDTKLVLKEAIEEAGLSPEYIRSATITHHSLDRVLTFQITLKLFKKLNRVENTVSILKQILEL